MACYDARAMELRGCSASLQAHMSFRCLSTSIDAQPAFTPSSSTEIATTWASPSPETVLEVSNPQVWTHGGLGGVEVGECG